MAYFSLAPPSPPTGLNHRFDCIDVSNCTTADDLYTCSCESVDLNLNWNDAIGEFDVQEYLVNISGYIRCVNITSDTIRVMPETDYLVLVHTVSRCEETSPGAMLEGIVRSRKLIYIHCVNPHPKMFYLRFISLSSLVVHVHKSILALYPGVSPEKPGRSDHMPWDIACVVLCVVYNYCLRTLT